MSESFASSDGCAVIEPRRIHRVAPLTGGAPMPGTNTSSSPTNEIASNGHVSTRITRTGMRTASHIAGSPRNTQTSCFWNTVNDDPDARYDATLDADSTI